jgi:hypothetical protein
MLSSTTNSTEAMMMLNTHPLLYSAPAINVVSSSDVYSDVITPHMTPVVVFPVRGLGYDGFGRAEVEFAIAGCSENS